MSRIVVVEDESAIAELIALNLRHAGYEVTVAATAEQAQAFDGLIASLVGRSDLGPHSPGVSYLYSFQPATTESQVEGIVGNCGNMALMLLCQFLYEVGKAPYVDMFVGWVRQNRATHSRGAGAPQRRALRREGAVRILPAPCPPPSLSASSPRS